MPINIARFEHFSRLERVDINLLCKFPVITIFFNRTKRKKFKIMKLLLSLNYNENPKK